jgi:hypothetical protein
MLSFSENIQAGFMMKTYGASGYKKSFGDRFIVLKETLSGFSSE